MAEVYWNDGAKAIFDNFVPPGIVHTILSAVMGRSLPEDRAYLEPVAGCMYKFIYYKYNQLLENVSDSHLISNYIQRYECLITSHPIYIH